MIDEIIQRLFRDPPATPLYHYTSLHGLLGIVSSGILRASDIRYMNDAAELRHTLDLLSDHITQRIREGTDHPAVLNTLRDWLSRRVVHGPMLFGASFRANGNLLSQWRGYSVHGKGVSLGFAPEDLVASARRQGFQVAPCVYAPDDQQNLITEIVDSVEALACQVEPEAGLLESMFEHLEAKLLRIAAILKHPSFEEEQEWRIVSPVIHDHDAHPIRFREGASMLVPYYSFSLHRNATEGMSLEHVFLGPTSNIELSMNSLRLFFENSGVSPRRGISYCRIPYRQR